MIHGTRPNTERDGMGERESWCTPAWIADAIGKFDLDPCSNSRSHVRATLRYAAEDGDDGLDPKMANVASSTRVFVNPPYSKGQVERWVKAYGHTRFCFLLRFDPSTTWFGALYKLSALVAIPRGKRVNFEPPPGVRASSNVFPHALFYARSEDATPAILRACLAWRTNRHG